MLAMSKKNRSNTSTAITPGKYGFWYIVNNNMVRVEYLLKLNSITSLAENQKEIRQLLAFFELVHRSSNYEKDFSRVVIDRNTKDYDIIMQWSKIFLFNKSFTTFSGHTAARALLFQMEKVFESYVTQQLRKVLSDMDSSHICKKIKTCRNNEPFREYL